MLQSLLEADFDSMHYVENGFEKLVVWDPFAMKALFRVELCQDHILLLANAVNISKPNFEPFNVRYESPPEGFVITTHAAGVVHSDESDDDSVAVPRFQETDYSLQDTMLEGLLIDQDWRGGINFDGGISLNVEEDLLGKMQFVDKDNPPFVAQKQLKRLLSAKTSCSSILNLLMAAETCSQDPEISAKYFQQYVASVRRSGPPMEKVHPWSLIIAARLKAEHTTLLISIFVDLFPMQRKILLSSESKLISGIITEKIDENLGWQDTLMGRWSELKHQYPLESTSYAMEKLLKLTGLRKVKEEALRLWSSALQLQLMSPATRKKNLFSTNYVFLGNPGCGKTTVARLFAKILHDAGVRGSDTIVETTAQEVKDGGTDELKKSVGNAMDGVLFIDEAYNLDPVGDYKGKPVVNDLLTICENKRFEISVILAGYEDDLEKKLFAYNSGLKSRFHTIMFEDFNEEELKKIWSSEREGKGWTEKDGVCRVAVKRMLKSTGKKGFGNAREVRKRVEDATRAAMTCLGQSFSMKNMMIEIEDVIGEDPRLANEKLRLVSEEIFEKIGWARVKKRVIELTELCGLNYQRELLGQPTLPVLLNRMFLGNPGTGKTTCAKLYGNLLKQLGFLSDGSVLLKSASDFIGSAVGESQTRTSQILETARGKVLIIDEAYTLDDSLYGKQVLDTLVEKVQGTSEDIAVLLLGYEEQMLSMLRNQNPGLARRFPDSHAFYFDDYNDNELLEIINLDLKTKGVKATLEFREKALDVLHRQRSQAHFGNAAAAKSLVKGAMLKAAARQGVPRDVFLIKEVDIDDPGTARAQKDVDPLSQLDTLYRMEKVKAMLEKMRKTWAVSKQDGEDDPSLGHFVFTGSPGNSFVAKRLFATLSAFPFLTGLYFLHRNREDNGCPYYCYYLFSLGLLPSDKIVEKSALDLTGDFVGQTKTKVNESLKESKGGVLFIDEAYNLGMRPYGKEACDTIVAAMTSEIYRDVVIVIAGYANEIDSMLNSNSGLKSRFNHFFDFPDWEANDCQLFFEMLSQKKKFSLGDGVLTAVSKGCADLIILDGWGNGRDVTKLWERAKANRDERTYDSKQVEKHILLEDVEETIASMMAARRPKRGKKKKNNDEYTELLTGTDANVDRILGQKMEAITAKQETLTEEASIEIDGARQETVHDQGCRDDGVPDEIWEDLVNEKTREMQRMKQQQHEERAYQLFLIQQEAEEREAQRLYQLEVERLRQILEQAELERALLAAEEAERVRRFQAEIKRRKADAASFRREEEARQKLETMKRLQQITLCPQGFSWYKEGNGWRCSGGSHYVSKGELRKRFGSDL